jgi:hypothetical protein
VFPPSTIKATRRPESRSRLRPDYVALRPAGALQGTAAYEWAIIESKGTQANLASAEKCPAGWYEQAHNVVITVDDSPIAIPRHLVVATRVNPNAARPRTRRIQLRAWNHTENSAQSRVSRNAAVDIAAAHVFGLFRNLRLRDNARAIALSVQ